MWIHFIDRLVDAVTPSQAGYHPVSTKAGMSDHSAARRIIRLIAAQSPTAEEHLPEEISVDARYLEGTAQQVLVNRYERNSEARLACVAHWGSKCAVCSFDFEQRYGALGAGFIHVHHLRLLSAQQELREVDPINDLRPVCPNCHAMLHRATPPLSVEALKQQLV